jgi:hypothetical protein
VLARQPVFIVAAVAGALGFGVMNLLMAATPIAMQVCSLPFEDVALVLEWHVIGMFAPGFFTGHLIRRLGVLPVMGVGLALNLGCILVALSGVDLHQFLVALFLLGVGWNFLFTGSTTLSLTAYTPEERDRAQGALNFCIFATLALSSFASGVLVTTQGWRLLNLGSLLPVALTGAALLWLARRRRRGRRGRRGLADREAGIEPAVQGVEHRLGIALVENFVVERRKTDAADERRWRRLGKGPAAGRVHEPVVPGIEQQRGHLPGRRRRQHGGALMGQEARQAGTDAVVAERIGPVGLDHRSGVREEVELEPVAHPQAGCQARQGGDQQLLESAESGVERR